MIFDTITAIATAPAPAGIAVIRLSGTATQTIIKKIFFGKNPIKYPRQMLLGKISDQANNQIDTGICVFFPGPGSYTGEDLAEFHIHGNPLLANSLINSICSFGARIAEPGEFTQRAFLNGKIDLTQAEAVGDLINATNEQAIKLANYNLRGALTNTSDEIAEPLRNILAELEASIDFSEEDINPENINSLIDNINLSKQLLQQLINTYQRSEIIRDGLRVLLCGSPNTGKSSLLNKILGKNRAIVSNISGTTRDLIEERINYKGQEIIFCDSAGIRNTEDQIEKIGVELALDKLSWAHIILLITAPDQTQAELNELKQNFSMEHKVWIVQNKSDLMQNKNIESEVIQVSALTSSGIDSLLEKLVQDGLNQLSEQSDTSNLIINLRHKLCLEKALAHLELINLDLSIEIICIELRQALTALEDLAGKTYTEDILGRIFSKFCIGK